jgi:dihydrolipoamide dehydrogenase
MQFDLIVIGSGPGGYKAAITAAHLGARVALVEKSLPGGTCLNQGCVPKKALLHLASLIEDINSLRGRGLLGEMRGDFGAAIAHKNSVIAGIRANFEVWLKRLSIDVFEGHARCVERSQDGLYRVDVEIEGGCQPLRTSRIIIATGSVPRAHEACPTDGVRIIHSGHFMTGLQQPPSSMLIVGGGAVGSELAFLLHQFGTRVTIVDSANRLLDKPCIPERASAALERKFTRLGVEIRKNTSVVECNRSPMSISVRFTDGSSSEYEMVLVAIGRAPFTDNLGLDTVGVTLDSRGFIKTNEYLETRARGIYAVGDVKLGPMSANAALHDAKIAATNAMQGNHAQANYNQVPIVIDSALEIAAVGLSEERAEAAGFSADAARTNLGSSAKARAFNDYEGFIEVVHDGETGQLLGGCIVGPEAGEQIHMMAAACQSERGLWFFTDMNYSHPSWTEELENAIDPYTFAFTKSGRELFRPGIYSRK